MFNIQKNEVTENYGSEKKVLTSYDLFMQKKYDKYNSSITNSIEKCHSLDNQKDVNGISKKLKDEVKKMSLNVKKGSYKDYLLARLQGKEKSEILSEEAYTHKLCAGEKIEFESSCKGRKTSASKDGAKQLTKAGKIFIAIYVIFTICIASTLLWVNTDGLMANYDASAYEKIDASNNDTITSLNQKEEKEGKNWFDRLCDSLN